MDPKSTMAYQPSCDCCQNAFLFSKGVSPPAPLFYSARRLQFWFCEEPNLLFQENAAACFGGWLETGNFSILLPQPPSHPTPMSTPLAGSSSQEALILEADYLLLIVWLRLQRSHWWISIWAIIMSTLFCQPSRTDCLFPQMKLHSKTVRLSQVPPFPISEKTQSCKGLKLGLLTLRLLVLLPTHH